MQENVIKTIHNMTLIIMPTELLGTFIYIHTHKKDIGKRLQNVSTVKQFELSSTDW